ncbi:MAG: Amino acid transporter [Frankiales bacterium]|nr:Amino acid transporter [Frankiales bacterium]
MATIDAVENPPGSHRLKSNALGLPSALGMSLAFISPTIGVLFISALVASKAGISSPFVFIFGTIGIALMASTLAQFTKRVTSAGTFYKFITLAFGPRTGLVAGMLLMFAYALQSPLNTNLFGGFVSSTLQADFGISVPWWVLMIVIVAAVGALAWYSVHVSMQFGIAFLIAEVVVVAVLLLLIVFKGGDSGQVPQAFTPTHSSGGFGGMGQAFVFIVLTFFGFESCSTVAEEVRNPRRNLPIALVGSVLLTGLWFTFAVYAIIVGYGAKHIDALASATAPLHDLANRYIGSWYATVVDIAAVSALVAVVLAIHTANFRVMYSLGRDGLLPRMCGRTHSKHQTPHIAILVYSAFTLVIGLIAGAGWGPMKAFGNLGYLSSLGILPIFILTNLALTAFMLKRYRDEFSVMLHLVFPTLSTLTFLAAIYLNLHPWPTSPLNVMPWIIVAVILGAVAWVIVLNRQGSEKLDHLGTVLFMAPGSDAAMPAATQTVPAEAARL